MPAKIILRPFKLIFKIFLISKSPHYFILISKFKKFASIIKTKIFIGLIFFVSGYFDRQELPKYIKYLINIFNYLDNSIYNLKIFEIF